MPADSATCVVREALVHAIGDGAIVEQRGEHFVHALEQRIAAAHVEERFLLAGERRVRQILGGGRGAHRDGDVAPAAHALERFEDLALEPRRERRRQNPVADLRADARELLDVVDVERRELLARCARRARRAAGNRDRPARSSRSRPARCTPSFARWLIISPSEEFLPPTVSTSCRPSFSKGRM